MAMVDYGAILKINGELKNLNSGLFMNMENAVGFSLEEVVKSYIWTSPDNDFLEIKKGEMYTEKYKVNGNYFIYFGDKDMLFCIYKYSVLVVTNQQVPHVISYNFYSDNKNIVTQKTINGVTIKIKPISKNREKLYLSVQYKGNNYEAIFGYGIDNNMKVYKDISKSKRYGYNNKIIKKVNKFLGVS